MLFGKLLLMHYIILFGYATVLDILNESTVEIDYHHWEFIAKNLINIISFYINLLYKIHFQ